MSAFRVTIVMPQHDRRYTVALEPGDRLRLGERLAALRRADRIIDFQIESQWIDPSDAMRLESFLAELESRAQS